MDQHVRELPDGNRQEKPTWGWIEGDRTAGEALALQAAEADSILGTAWFPQALPGATLEYRLALKHHWV